MIVPSMNSKELLKEIFEDLKIVYRKACYLTESLRREAIKSKTKHVHRIFDYKSKRLNNWFIVVYYVVGHPGFLVVVYYIDEYGLNGIRVDADNQSLTHFTPHFLERYNERFLKLPDLSKLELLKRFIPNNPVEVIQSIFDDETEQYNIFGRVKEGIVLGYKEVFREEGKEINHYKTFISNEMINESQTDDFNSTSRLYKSYLTELPKNIRRCA
jgi:hypothetical protein